MSVLPHSAVLGSCPSSVGGFFGGGLLGHTNHAGSKLRGDLVPTDREFKPLGHGALTSRDDRRRIGKRITHELTWRAGWVVTRRLAHKSSVLVVGAPAAVPAGGVPAAASAPLLILSSKRRCFVGLEPPASAVLVVGKQRVLGSPLLAQPRSHGLAADA